MGIFLDTLLKMEFLKKPRARELLERFEKNLGLENWKPPKHDWQRILFWSLILERVQGNQTMGELIQSFSSEILELGKPKPETISEMSGAALADILGWKPMKLKRTHTRTPDFLATHEGCEFEFEITKADPKTTHLELAEYGNGILKRIHDESRSHDIVAMLADCMTHEEEMLFCETVGNLSVGEIREVEGLWKAVAEPYRQRSRDQVNLRRFQDLPTWWPCKHEDSRLRIMAVHTLTPNTPATTVACALPIHGYLNPLKRKAGRFQGSKARPLLLGLEVEHLPGAFEELDFELPRRFSRWRHLSGVLAYQASLRPDKIGWLFKLYTNEFATLALPYELPMEERHVFLWTENFRLDSPEAV